MLPWTGMVSLLVKRNVCGMALQSVSPQDMLQALKDLLWNMSYVILDDIFPA